MAAATAATIPMTNNNDYSFLDRKIDIITEGIQPFIANKIRNISSKENALAITNFILALNTEINPSASYRKQIIWLLCVL